MKLAPKIILFILILISLIMDIRPLHAAGPESNCEHVNHPAFQEEYRTCLRVQIAASAKEAGVDCVDCIFQQKDESNAVVEAVGVIAQPLAYFLGTYAVAKFQYATQKKWADAYASGFTECTNRFNSYLNYNTTIGANPISATDAASLGTCNGYGYGSYAGYGGLTSNGYGGYGNPFLASGFSNNFMSGYGNGYWGSSMYGASSLYNSGMLSGSIGVSGTLGTTSSSVYQNGVTSAFGF